MLAISWREQLSSAQPSSAPAAAGYRIIHPLPGHVGYVTGDAAGTASAVHRLAGHRWQASCPDLVRCWTLPAAVVVSPMH